MKTKVNYADQSDRWTPKGLTDLMIQSSKL